jgi:hypothetical protein
MLLVVVAILVLLYATEVSVFFKPAPKRSAPNAMPWEEHHLILNPALDGYINQRRKPSAEQPQFVRTVYLKAQVQYGEEPRGLVEFEIDCDGAVQGSWSADYVTGSTQFVTQKRIGGHFMSNTFRGNIVPSKVYKDQYGPDKSVLYIIAKGDFVQSAQTLERKQTREVTGNVYLTGWVAEDYYAFGKLTLVPGGVRPRKDYAPGKPLFKADTFLVFNWEALGKQAPRGQKAEERN